MEMKESASNSEVAIDIQDVNLWYGEKQAL